MNVKRTDLAFEAHEINAENGVDDGIVITEETIDGIPVTVAVVKEGRGEKEAGKPAGTYITADIGRIWDASGEMFNSASKALCSLLLRLLPKGSPCVLAAGLGNGEITADSVGPKVVSSLIATRHIKSINSSLYSSLGFGELCALAPGVLGQTGIESSDIVRSVAQTVNPDCIIVIDALVSRRLERLATTVQISDTGIMPGSGVGSARSELSRDTLGTKVISIGVPTVVEAHTLVADLLEEAGADTGAAGRLNGDSLFVAPKESDIMTDSVSRLIAASINLAVHKGMKIEEMNEYLA
ncbi:MAG: GPR endopeptidase [Eubacteriales bacterium]